MLQQFKNECLQNTVSRSLPLTASQDGHSSQRRSAIIRHRLRIMMYLFFTPLFKQITHNFTVGTIRNQKYTLHCFKRYFEFLIPMSRSVRLSQYFLLIKS